jgi:hypothetical protein
LSRYFSPLFPATQAHRSFSVDKKSKLKQFGDKKNIVEAVKEAKAKVDYEKFNRTPEPVE